MRIWCVVNMDGSLVAKILLIQLKRDKLNPLSRGRAWGCWIIGLDQVIKREPCD